jgi:hypothetical protein
MFTKVRQLKYKRHGRQLRQVWKVRQIRHKRQVSQVRQVG